MTHIEKWAYKSDVIFNPEKTILSYLLGIDINYQQKLLYQLILNLAKKLSGKSKVKHFRVIFDEEFTYKQHITKKAKRNIRVVLALSHLKNLKPKSHADYLHQQ